MVIHAFDASQANVAIIRLLSVKSSNTPSTNYFGIWLKCAPLKQRILLKCAHTNFWHLNQNYLNYALLSRLRVFGGALKHFNGPGRMGSNSRVWAFLKNVIFPFFIFLLLYSSHVRGCKMFWFHLI